MKSLLAVQAEVICYIIEKFEMAKIIIYKCENISSFCNKFFHFRWQKIFSFPNGFFSTFLIIDQISLGTITKTEEDIICSPREGHPQASQILINIFFHNDKVNLPVPDYFLASTTTGFESKFVSKNKHFL